MTEGSSDKKLLEGRLVEILHRISGADPSVITPDARLIEDIGIDSLGFYEILIEADTSFGIRILKLIQLLPGIKKHYLTITGKHVANVFKIKP